MAKAPDAFRTISEVSELLDTPPHVLRFWESRFTQVRPVKRAGGRRYYRPADLLLLGGIKRLLHDDGMTIRGVQKMLSDQGVPHVAGLADPALLAANDGTAPAKSYDADPEDSTAKNAIFDAETGPETAADADDEHLQEEAHPEETADPAPAQDTTAEDAAMMRAALAKDAPASAREAPDSDARESDAPDAPVGEAPVTADAEADLLARIRATLPGADAPATDEARGDAEAAAPDAGPDEAGPDDAAEIPSEPEDRAMPDAPQPAPEAAAPTLAQIAARLRRLEPADVADNRAGIEALRTRLLALHKVRSERLAAARF